MGRSRQRHDEKAVLSLDRHSTKSQPVTGNNSRCQVRNPPLRLSEARPVTVDNFPIRFENDIGARRSLAVPRLRQMTMT